MKIKTKQGKTSPRIRSIMLIALMLILGATGSFAQTWKDVLEFVDSEGVKDDMLGYSVAISGDFAIVGTARSKIGAAYILEKQTNGWALVKKITASDGKTGDYFGKSVAISGDYAIVGAYRDKLDENGGSSTSGAGSAYIFEKNTGGTDKWGQVRKIVASDRGEKANDYFGYSVGISGNYAIVGSDKKKDYSTQAVYIFSKTKTNDSWGETQKIETTDNAKDGFGNNVAISGNYAIVGVSNGGFGDAAYIYKDLGGNWGNVTKIVSNDKTDYDGFGCSVAISGDYAIVGSFYGSYDNAYIFKRNTGEENNWEQSSKITIGLSSQNFDYQVGITSNYAIVGAYNADEKKGSAYIFEKNNSDEWGEVKKIVASDGVKDDFFGCSVAISDNYAIVGAYGNDEKKGKAYIYYPSNINSDPQNTQVCESTSADFSVSVDGNATYKWQVNKSTSFVDISTTEYSGVTTNKLTITAAPSSINGYKYRCVVTLDGKEENSSVATLTVHEKTTISTHPQDASANVGGDAIILSVEASGTNLTYEWEKDNKNIAESSKSISIETKVVNSGSYKCIVNGTCSNVTSEEANVLIEEAGNKDVGNNNGGKTVFSPNGDGQNDVWIAPDGKTYPEHKLVIYNNIGEVIYSSNSYNNDWDGTHNGTKLPSGTVCYFVFVKGSDIVKGTIAILYK